MRTPVNPPEAYARRIFTVLETARVMTGTKHKDWAKVLKMSALSYEADYLSGCHSLPASALAYAAERLNLPIEAFLEDWPIDYDTLVSHFRGEIHEMPEKYAIASFSKKRTAVNLLDYVGGYDGAIFRAKLLRSLQLSERSLSDLDSPVNIQLITDLIDGCRKLGYDDRRILSIGAHSLETNRPTAFGSELAKAKTTAHVYERMVTELVGFYEKNCSYKLISLSADSCIVESISNPDVATALGVRHVGSPSGCIVKSGILTSTPGYIDMPFAKVIETHCVFRGDPACRFHIDFSQARYIETHPEESAKPQPALRSLSSASASPKMSRAFHSDSNFLACAKASSAN